MYLLCVASANWNNLMFSASISWYFSNLIMYSNSETLFRWIQLFNVKDNSIMPITTFQLEVTNAVFAFAILSAFFPELCATKKLVLYQILDTLYNAFIVWQNSAEQSSQRGLLTSAHTKLLACKTHSPIHTTSKKLLPLRVNTFFPGHLWLFRIPTLLEARRSYQVSIRGLSARATALSRFRGNFGCFGGNPAGKPSSRVLSVRRFRKTEFARCFRGGAGVQKGRSAVRRGCYGFKGGCLHLFIAITAVGYTKRYFYKMVTGIVLFKTW